MSDIKALKEQLFYTPKNGLKTADDNLLSAIFDYCEDYKKFLDAAKTEREAVKTALDMAKEKGFIPVITTNGTLLTENAARLLDAKPHKIQISIHSHEGNGGADPDGYIARVMNFSTDAAERGIIVVLRLWNQGGYERNNERILELIARHVPRPWTERYDGWKISPNLYVEFDKMFEWPDEDHEEYAQEEVFCYALRNQIGVLADGTVVPCCLDHDGAVPLGNLFRQSLHDILSTPRAVSLLEGFSHHYAAEPFCRKCGYASVTKRFRK